MRVTENFLDRTVTVELDDGRRLNIDRWAVAQYGLSALLKAHGVALPTGRVNVVQRGRVIGTLPADWHPVSMRSTSWLYQPREGDFTPSSDGVWVASNTLGPGDLTAVEGFRSV